jgi:hypothetical protein
MELKMERKESWPVSRFDFNIPLKTLRITTKSSYDRWLPDSLSDGIFPGTNQEDYTTWANLLSRYTCAALFGKLRNVTSCPWGLYISVQPFTDPLIQSSVTHVNTSHIGHISKQYTELLRNRPRPQFQQLYTTSPMRRFLNLPNPSGRTRPWGLLSLWQKWVLETVK